MPHDDHFSHRIYRDRIVTIGTETVVPISRAVNVSVEQPQVVAMCKKHDATISAIETLPSGGTRVVLMNSADAAKIIKAFGSKVLTGTVARTHWMRAV
ncbi:hypothetical protein C8J47_3520 [Sphingomonas sp. PP-F2F-G114-C0414]|nr:hypothetical protein C8J47_3520 [Sphingomonas sp. PP-F2F-G114-C0414]